MPSRTDQSVCVEELQLQIDSLKQQVADLQSEQIELHEQLRTAQQSSEDATQAAQVVLQEQHAGQMSVLKSEFECLLEDYTAKDQQVNGLLRVLFAAFHLICVLCADVTLTSCSVFAED